MNKNNTTYADLKHLPPKRQTQKEKIKEQPIYSEVKTSTSKSNQTKTIRTKSSKGKESSGPFTWLCTVVILGILCLFLLLTTGILGIMVFQGHQKYQSQRMPVNKVAQEDNSTFKSITLQEEPLNPGIQSRSCESKWSCCGEKCYYFSSELKTFEESREFCKKMDSTLLKIDDEKELKFIQSQLIYFSWIGLSRKGTSSIWKWEDNSTPSLASLKLDWKESSNGNCAKMTARNLAPSDCSKSLYYVCEKEIVCLAA